MVIETIMPRKENILRYPRLDTVLMVEDFIKEHDGNFKKKKLWELLPKKMMYQTYDLIIRYLMQSRKVSIDNEGKVGWMYYPEKTEEYYIKKELSRKK